MGTPGGNLPRLPGHCEHKLPTSCLLTSTRQCCACEDQRQHTSTYTVYVDGSGLRPWGQRWINYCWPCKEYWDHRTGNGVLPSTITRIPEVPSQDRFLDRWNWFYERHHSLQHALSGSDTHDSEHEQSLPSPSSLLLQDASYYQEPWRDVDPGRLPRTREEMNSGAVRSAYEIAIDAEQQRELLASQHRAVGPTVDIDEALDQLMDLDDEQVDAAVDLREESSESEMPRELHVDDAEDDQVGLLHDRRRWTERRRYRERQEQGREAGESNRPLQSTAGGALRWAPEVGVARRLRALRPWGSIASATRADSSGAADQRLTRQRSESAVDGLRNLLRQTNHAQSSGPEEASGTASPTSALPGQDRSLNQTNDVQPSDGGPSPDQDDLQPDTDAGDQHTPIAQFSDEQLRRLLLLQMATDAAAHRVMQTWPPNLDREFANAVQLLVACGRSERGLPPAADVGAEAATPVQGSRATGDTPRHQHRDTETQRQRSALQDAIARQEQQRIVLDSMIDETQRYIQSLQVQGTWTPPAVNDGHVQQPPVLDVPQTLDSALRPPPLRDDQTLIRVECGVCLQQIANIALIPCGHVVMCEWCAEVHAPLMPGSMTATRHSATQCPTCRKYVKNRIKLFFG